MKPKGKADELIAKYMELFGRHDRVTFCVVPNARIAYKHSKECAIFTANEVLKTAFLEDGNNDFRTGRIYFILAASNN